MSIEPTCDDPGCDADAWPWVTDPSLQTYPDHPLVDADSAWVLAQATTGLAVTRCPGLGSGDALAELHTLVSLLRQGRAFLADVVADARTQNRSWAEIAAQLQLSPADAARRYGSR